MHKDEVEYELGQADADPRIRNELKEVVREINAHVLGEKTKAMMYDLVHVVLEMDERIRQLEYQVCAGSIQEELKRQQRVFAKRDRYFRPSD